MRGGQKCKFFSIFWRAALEWELCNGGETTILLELLKHKQQYNTFFHSTNTFHNIPSAVYIHLKVQHSTTFQRTPSTVQIRSSISIQYNYVPITTNLHRVLTLSTPPFILQPPDASFFSLQNHSTLILSGPPGTESYFIVYIKCFTILHTLCCGLQCTCSILYLANCICTQYNIQYST